MPKQPSTDLFDLIKSMTSSEKRYFSLEVSVKNIEKDVAYYRLFNSIDKMDSYNESSLVKQLSKKGENENLPFKKIHLHKLILTSLNRYHRNSGPEEEVLNLLQNLKILYDRGLYWQAEKLVKRIESLCEEFDLKEYQVVLLKWQKIMTIHMQNSRIAKNLSQLNESEAINKLVKIERELLAYLDSNLDVWQLVIKIADKLRLESDLDQAVNKTRKNIFNQLESTKLSFISRIRLHHSEMMLTYLVNNSKDSYNSIKECLQLWEGRPKMKVPYFRNYMVSLNLIVGVLVDIGNLDECEPHLQTLLSFTRKNNKKISFIDKCKAYSFYYKSNLVILIKRGQYEHAIKSFELPHVRQFFQHFGLFKKSQIYLGLTVANFHEENYKEISKTMVLSHIEEDVVQKGCLHEIRILYYPSIYKLKKFEMLDQILNSSDQKIVGRLSDYTLEVELIRFLISASKTEASGQKIIELLGKRDNTNIRYYQDRLKKRLELDFI
jgi:hypothetical protein